MTASLKSSEVVVVGGGIIGCAIAYYTAKAGLEVTLVERGELGGGTSSHCDGNILAIDKDPGFDSQMGLKSQELMRDLARELDDFEYRAPGSILVCENEQELEAARSWVDRQCAAGLPFRMLDRQDLKDDSPYFAPDLVGGLECASDATCSPPMLIYALVRKAQEYGARFLSFTEVTGFQRNAGGAIEGVVTRGGTIATRTAVNAAGVWAPALCEQVGISLLVMPRKGHILVAGRTIPVSRRKVMEFGYLMSKFGGSRVVDEETDRYGVALVYEPTMAGNFLVGSSRQFVGIDTTIDSRVISVIARRAIRFYPIMKDVPFIRAYAGVRPWTPDHLPVISPVTDVPGLYVAAGHEGDGIGLAPVTGKVISEMLTGQPTSIPTTPVSLDRFDTPKVHG
ncbi:MAG TPA: FAD-dependent oxidoreductase [Symbiobacteriaceae bacterium]|nr:FAD-dependent oxidoreductase [Symbiobacteriaceae bacterium]